jgi:two-component system phosphate regulon sensor histidine kinase PhoR
LETAAPGPTTSAPTASDRVARFFHVAIEPRSYLNALYLLTAFPLGFTYFAVLLTGSLLGAMLSLFVVGLLILVVCLVAAWGFALFERELAIWLLGARIPPLSLPNPELVSPWQMLIRHLKQPTTWRSLAYLVVKLPFGLFASFLSLALLGPCIVGIAIPVADAVSSGPRPEAVARLILPGIPAFLGLVISMHLLNFVARAWGRFAADMLGVSPEQHQVWESRRQAERADQSRRELIMNVSHELRTPIATIQAQLDSLLLPEGERPPAGETEQRLRVTAAETRRLSDLIEDLLMLARADAHELRVTIRPVAIAPIVDQVVQSMAPLARQQRQVTVSEEAASNAHWAIADPDRLNQVISNLVRNAINYTPEGGVVSIRVTASDPDRVQIAVSDTGVGMPAADLEHAFERFYRADSSRARNSGGFGLGLSIARELVEAMGGSLTATSEQGLGSTFWISLRRAAPPSL